MTRDQAEAFLALPEPDRMKLMRSLGPSERVAALLALALAFREPEGEGFQELMAA